jgi:ribonuclease-3 family protein
LSLEKTDEVRLMQPSVLAFLGDAVFNLFIRERLISNKKGTSHQLHVYATEYVKASAQAEISKSLLPELTEEEANIFRRGRNVKSATVPRHAEIKDYRNATAFEAVLGYLYLTGQRDRLNYIMEKAADIIEKPESEMKNEKRE